MDIGARKRFKRIEAAQVEASENIVLLTRAMITSDVRMTRLEDSMRQTERNLDRMQVNLDTLIQAIAAEHTNGREK